MVKPSVFVLGVHVRVLLVLFYPNLSLTHLEYLAVRAYVFHQQIMIHVKSELNFRKVILLFLCFLLLFRHFVTDQQQDVWRAKK